MRIEELEVVCLEAARNVVERQGRPIIPTVVLPLPSATQVSALADWPDDDQGRLDLLQRFATEVMRPVNAPCYGFIAEGVAELEGHLADVVVVAFGARGQHPRVTAAPLTEEGLGDFAAAEELEPAALPFLAALQHAATEAEMPDAFGGGD